MGNYRSLKLSSISVVLVLSLRAWYHEEGQPVLYHNLINWSVFVMSLLNGLEDPNLNPLKFLRLQTGRSPELFAKDAGIQLAAVGQAEEGFYPNPLPAYLLALEILPGTQDEIVVTEAYHEYQTTKRISNGPK